jgi:hypothetical protein
LILLCLVPRIDSWIVGGCGLVEDLEVKDGGRGAGPGVRFGVWRYVGMCLVLMVITAGVEFGMGRIGISKSGKILLWVNETNGAETSQQMFDWYSVTHVEHGLVLYGVVWAVHRGLARMGVGRKGKAWSFGVIFLWGVFLEAAWEVLENSPFIIDRYREATAANGYTGDTVLNSMMDIVCCAAGLVVTRYLPWWGTVVALVVIEVTLALVIRDNLTLNGIMLIHPVEAIKRWQSGG